MTAYVLLAIVTVYDCPGISAWGIRADVLAKAPPVVKEALCRVERTPDVLGVYETRQEALAAASGATPIYQIVREPRSAPRKKKLDVVWEPRFKE